jgi:hypothetical protein
LQEDRKLGAAAAWENKTDSRMEQNKLQQRFAALKAQADADLGARQDKLAQQLHAEEQALKQELISCQTTPAQRRAQMAARAHDLARRREAERQQLAAALMDQSFRDNCDPLRERESRRLVYRTAQEREQQVCLGVRVVLSAAGCHILACSRCTVVWGWCCQPYDCVWLGQAAGSSLYESKRHDNVCCCSCAVHQVQEKLAISMMQEEERRMFDTMHEAEYRKMKTRWG